MPTTLAFDVYGTLINTHGIVDRLRAMVGERAEDFSRSWREKQLEYAFRRGLMQSYEDFAVCTRQALDYTSADYASGLSDLQKEDLLQAYRTLPAFSDVRSGLAGLRQAGFNLYAFSNGSARAVEDLLLAAEINEFFISVVSVEAVGSFKPDPAVYAHFLSQAGVSAAEAWLISGNPFDVIGAVSAGMHAAWVKRFQHAIFDPWGIDPTITVTNLQELQEYMQENWTA